MILDSNKTYICVQKCPELDCENGKHCTGTGDYIKRRESIGRDFCPCGHIEIWEDYKEKSQ